MAYILLTHTYTHICTYSVSILRCLRLSLSSAFYCHSATINKVRLCVCVHVFKAHKSSETKQESKWESERVAGKGKQINLCLATLLTTSLYGNFFVPAAAAAPSTVIFYFFKISSSGRACSKCAASAETTNDDGDADSAATFPTTIFNSCTSCYTHTHAHTCTQTHMYASVCCITFQVENIFLFLILFLLYCLIFHSALPGACCCQ